MSEKRALPPAWHRFSGPLGVGAAMVIAVLLNVLASRHYKRWDWTAEGRFTLSTGTTTVLAGLTRPVDVYVLLPQDDALNVTLRHLLESYQSHTRLVQTRFIDPDRSPAELLAVQKTYGVESGKTEDGKTVTDAQIIIAQGERHRFITASDLFAVEEGEERRAQPRAEQVLTFAIRSLAKTTAAKVCFTGGYGEPDFDSGGKEGVMPLRRRLLSNDLEPMALPPLRDITTTDPIRECRVLLLAAPSVPLPRAEIDRFSRFVDRGGNLMAFVGPVPNDGETGYVDVGVSPLLAKFGVVPRSEIVFEGDAAHRSSEGFGETFLANVEAHPITQGLVDTNGSIGVVLTISRSLTVTDSPPAAVHLLLRTTPKAIGMKDFFGWAKRPGPPVKQEQDSAGPLPLAYAIELPRNGANAATKKGDASSKDSPAETDHGARAVIVASSSPLYGGNWSTPQLRGTALFVEGAVSWLAARPSPIDVPIKNTYRRPLTITESTLGETQRRVLGYLPLSLALLGAAVLFRRRATQGRRRIDDGDDRDERSEKPAKGGDEKRTKPVANPTKKRTKARKGSKKSATPAKSLPSSEESS